MNNLARPGLRRWLLGILLLLALLVLESGRGIYLNQRNDLRREVENQLEAIAELKVRQIQEWRKEWLTDGLALMHNSLFCEAVARWMANGNQADGDYLRKLFEAMHGLFDCRSLRLVDVKGGVKMSLDGDMTVLVPDATQALAAALEKQEPILTEVFLQGEAFPEVDVIVPVFTSSGFSIEAVGAVIFQNDARQYLYPSIQSWPVQSKSAEALLVRREGGHALLLNDLRTSPDAAMRMRISLTQTNVPSVQAVLGRRGIFEGYDYRGVRVISNLKGIPGSAWFLVTKVDYAEAFGPLSFRTILIFTLGFGLLLGLGAVVAIVWEEDEKAQFRALLAEETARRRCEEGFRILIEQAAVGMAEIEASSRAFVRVNKEYAAIVGHSLEELKQVTDQGLTYAEDRTAGLSQMNLLLASQIETFAIDKRYLRKDGDMVWASFKATRLWKNGEKPSTYIAVVQDITARKRLEEELSRTAADWQTSFDASKDAIWLMDKDQKVLRANKMVAEIFHRQPDEIVGKPCWEIMHGTSKPISSCPFCRSCKSLHRETAEMPLGDRYVEVRVDPTLDQGGQLAGAVHIVADITERKRTEETLRENEERWRFALEAAQQGAFDWDIPGNQVAWSACHERLWGFEPGTFDGTYESYLSRIHPYDRPRFTSHIDKVINQPSSLAIEFRVLLPDRTIHHIESRAKIICSDSGVPQRLVGIVRKIG